MIAYAIWITFLLGLMLGVNATVLFNNRQKELDAIDDAMLNHPAGSELNEPQLTILDYTK